MVDRASVAGASVEPSLLAELCDDVPDLDAVLAALVRAEIFTVHHDRLSSEQGRYQFVQSVVRQVAYATLSRRDRKQIHLQLLEAMSRDEAPSWRRWRPSTAVAAIEAAPDDEDAPELTARAVGLLRRAAARAQALGAPGEAIGHLARAAELAADGRQRCEIQLAEAEASNDAGKYEQGARSPRLLAWASGPLLMKTAKPSRRQPGPSRDKAWRRHRRSRGPRMTPYLHALQGRTWQGVGAGRSSTRTCWRTAHSVARTTRASSRRSRWRSGSVTAPGRPGHQQPGRPAHAQREPTSSAPPSWRRGRPERVPRHRSARARARQPRLHPVATRRGGQPGGRRGGGGIATGGHRHQHEHRAANLAIGRWQPVTGT